MGEQAIESPPARAQRIPLPYEEYLLLAHHDVTRAEWKNGEAIIFMPPPPNHQDLVGFLDTLLRIFLHLFKTGIVLVAPTEMRLSPSGPSREPDLLVVTNEHLERLTATRLEGPADLAIEIISDESVGRNRGEKFYEYQESGIQEYWILDPRPGKERIDMYWLTTEGRYQAILPDPDGSYHSQLLPGFSLRHEWLLHHPFPSPLATLAHMPLVLQKMREEIGG